VGEAPELMNYFVAAGMNSIGILSGGGLGRVMAHWIVHGKPDVDVTGMNIDRFHKYQCNESYRAARVVESLANVYMCHYPYKPLQTARMAKRSPFYDRLRVAGAVCKDVSGWEVADWFGATDDNGDVPEGAARSEDPPVYSFKRPYFFENWKKEHVACREGVVLIDMSFMSKFLVVGRDAGPALNRY
jgi:4-methylaminobutanoate oxidase (formaldehyde-forming)